MSFKSKYYDGATTYGGSSAVARRAAARIEFYKVIQPSQASTSSQVSRNPGTKLLQVDVMQRPESGAQLSSSAKRFLSWIETNNPTVTKRQKHTRRFNPILPLPKLGKIHPLVQPIVPLVDKQILMPPPSPQEEQPKPPVVEQLSLAPSEQQPKPPPVVEKPIVPLINKQILMPPPSPQEEQPKPPVIEQLSLASPEQQPKTPPLVEKPIVPLIDKQILVVPPTSPDKTKTCKHVVPTLLKFDSKFKCEPIPHHYDGPLKVKTKIYHFSEPVLKKGPSDAPKFIEPVTNQKKKRFICSTCNSTSIRDIDLVCEECYSTYGEKRKITKRSNVVIKAASDEASSINRATFNTVTPSQEKACFNFGQGGPAFSFGNTVAAAPAPVFSFAVDSNAANPIKAASDGASPTNQATFNSATPSQEKAPCFSFGRDSPVFKFGNSKTVTASPAVTVLPSSMVSSSPAATMLPPAIVTASPPTVTAASATIAAATAPVAAAPAPVFSFALGNSDANPIKAASDGAIPINQATFNSATPSQEKAPCFSFGQGGPAFSFGNTVAAPVAAAPAPVAAAPAPVFSFAAGNSAPNPIKAASDGASTTNQAAIFSFNNASQSQEKAPCFNFIGQGGPAFSFGNSSTIAAAPAPVCPFAADNSASNPFQVNTIRPGRKILRPHRRLQR